MGKEIRLIILYGGVGSTSGVKNQNLIDGKFTCGYREYARKYGVIVYMSPQKRLKNEWEKVIVSVKEVIDFCNFHPNAIVWSVKYAASKDVILSSIRNFKIYYSCHALNSLNKACHVSLVDTIDRIGHKSQFLHLKGKDPDFWGAGVEKKFDYLLMGMRDDKNQPHFINALNSVKDTRRILWIGGSRFKSKIDSSHKVCLTPPLSPERVAEMIPLAKVGVLFSEIVTEGFPQSFLEMAMCGVPVVYGGPFNSNYFTEYNSTRPKKKHMVVAAERLLKARDSRKCRSSSIERFSIEASFNYFLHLRKCLNWKL